MRTTIFQNESIMTLTFPRLNLTRAAALALVPLAAAGLAATVPATAQSSSALSSVQSHLKSTSSMTADFVQTDRNGQRLSGKLTLKRPGKIRFQYQKGVPLLIVGDGSSLTMIDYEVRQVQRWPVKNSPLGALLDPDRDLTRYAKVLPTGSNDVLSVEVKDPKRPEYGTITMVFVRDGSAPAGLRLRGWVALDSQNNRTRIDLSNQKFNVAVADSAFRWTDPRPNKRGR
jgi:outer membrane lipoprotein-sorting protein